ncbi:hypothetical protein SEUCBS139899_003718 [Sporothrix eucalyptigena]|uniref:Zn(2)-C6 fungal-type domain-containing protein n=1 Tax=Sporothrix eucalyptigena TaxID=1812306 RepID=A0ABP0BPX7_9PEZI
MSKRKLSVDASTSSDVDPAPTYPKKRAAIACTVCRLRKSRCDGGRPACGLCYELGVKCNYTPPTVGNSRSTEQAALERIENALQGLYGLEGLQGLQDSIHNLQSQVAGLSQRMHLIANKVFETQPLKPPSTLQTSTQLSSPHFLTKPLVRPSLEFIPPIDNLSLLGLRQSQGELSCPRPNLLTFCCTSSLRSPSWDDTEAFYDDELKNSELLSKATEMALLRGDDLSQESGLDLSKQTTRYLQHGFVESFLRWYPIWDVPESLHFVEKARDCGFDASEPATCVAMLLFSIGAIAQAGVEVTPTSELPGIDYFARGVSILEQRRPTVTKGFLTLQCRFLQAIYCQLCFMPLQAWNSVSTVSRDLMHALSSSLPARLDPADRASLHRLFWACSTVHHELEAVLIMHPTGIRAYHDYVPLPLSETDDACFYYFLAQISLRQLLFETLDVVGFKRGQVNRAPIVTAEIRKSIRDWYCHLPPTLRFPLEKAPLFDTRKAYLRAQYLSLFVLLGWPSVLVLFEMSPAELQGEGRTAPSQSELERLKSDAKDCLGKCALLLESSDEVLSQRTLGTQLVMWSCYASLIELILTYNNPIFAFAAPATTDDHAIRCGYEILSTWKHLPIVNRGLARAKYLMASVGIHVED